MKRFNCIALYCFIAVSTLASCQDDLGERQEPPAPMFDMPDTLDSHTADGVPAVDDLNSTDLDQQDIRDDLEMIGEDMPDISANPTPNTPQPLIIEENCKCYNEAETCVLFPRYGQIRCQLKGTSCLTKEDCGVGYFCAENSVCECDDADSPHYCAAKCENNGDCPLHLECDPLGNKCADRDACRDDLHCRSGSYCVQTDEPYKNERTCEFPPLNGKPLGEVCSKHFDCESLGCYYNKCVVRCLSDGDCVDGERCAWSLIGGNYCVKSLVECPMTCSAPNTLCWDNCAPARCRNTSDCTEGDCVILAAGKVSLGTCATGSEGINLCKPNEWRESVEDPYCHTTRCTIDAECTGAERCLPTRLGTREPFCARQVRPVP